MHTTYFETYNLLTHKKREIVKIWDDGPPIQTIMLHKLLLCSIRQYVYMYVVSLCDACMMYVSRRSRSMHGN